MKTFSFESMGTSFEVSVWDDISEDRLLELKDQSLAMAQEFDQKYSRFKRDSLVWEIAQKRGVFKVDEDFMAMLKIYFELFPLSQKKFSPLIGFSLADMGYDDRYSLIPKNTIRPTPDLNAVVTILSNSEISVADPVLIDFGGIGKGYFVDKLASFLKRQNIQRFLVNGSGDMYYSGGEPIVVGLEDPRDPAKVIGTFSLGKGAFASSGSQKRNWGKYHHIIDPLTLSSPTDVVASFVTAESAVVTDSLATCLFLCSPENFAYRYQFEYLLVNKEYKTKKSPGFIGELFA